MLPLERDCLLTCKECNTAAVIVAKGTILREIGDCFCSGCSSDGRVALNGFSLYVREAEVAALRMVSDVFQILSKPIPMEPERSLWEILREEEV